MSKTDRTQVLAALRKAGARGVHSFDLIRTISPRVAARIEELRKEGITIASTREKRGRSWGVRYTLVESPLAQCVKETLIDPPPQHTTLTPEPEAIRKTRRNTIAQMRKKFLEQYA